MMMKCKLIVGEKWYRKKLIADYFADQVYEKLNAPKFRGKWGDVTVELVCENKNSPKSSKVANDSADEEFEGALREYYSAKADVS